MTVASQIPSIRMPKRRTDVTCRQIGNEAILYDPVRDTVHFLNETALFIWHACRDSADVDSVAEALGQAFGQVATESLRADICTAIEHFISDGLMDVEAGR